MTFTCHLEDSCRGFSKGSRDYLSDPSVERPGRFSPIGERFYASNPFDKTRWECERMFSMGVAERSVFSGDVSGEFETECTPDVSYTKRSSVYKNVSFKGRVALPKTSVVTPGPGHYKTSESLSDTRVNARGVTILCRPVDSKLFMESTSKPGPDAYNIRRACGVERPAFSLGGRCAELKSSSSPSGPGEYHIKTIFDKYNISPIGWQPPFTKRLSC